MQRLKGKGKTATKIAVRILIDFVYGILLVGGLVWLSTYTGYR